MDRRRALAVVVGVLGVIALVFAGATLTNPDTSAGGESGGLGVEGDGSGFLPINQNTSDIDVTYPPFLRQLFSVVMVLFLLVGIVSALLTVSMSDLAKLVLGAIAAALFGWLLFRFLAWVLGGGGGGGLLAGAGDGSGGLSLGAPDASESVSSLPVPVWASAALVVIVGIVIVVALSGETSTGEHSEPKSDDANRQRRLQAVGDAAGRAATRIDAGENATNAVYTAWAEMTAALDVENPDSTTPAAFSRAAVEAGMAEADVEELTQLFVDVRYGETSVSPERERRARRALERIESTYASIDSSAVESASNEGEP